MTLTCSTQLLARFSISMRIRENVDHEIRDGSTVLVRIADSSFPSWPTRPPYPVSNTIHVCRWRVHGGGVSALPEVCTFVRFSAQPFDEEGRCQ